MFTCGPTTLYKYNQLHDVICSYKNRVNVNMYMFQAIRCDNSYTGTSQNNINNYYIPVHSLNNHAFRTTRLLGVRFTHGGYKRKCIMPQPWIIHYQTIVLSK